MAAWLTERIGTVKLHTLTAEHLDRIYAQMTAAGLSSATIHKYHAFISGALSQGLKWNLVSSNVANKASPPKVVSPVEQVLTADDVATLVATADTLHDSRYTYRNAHTVMATLLYVAAHTGMRRGEACALLWSDIDFDAETITVSKALHMAKEADGGYGVKAPKSERGNRVVDIIRAGDRGRGRDRSSSLVDQAEAEGGPRLGQPAMLTLWAPICRAATDFPTLCCEIRSRLSRSHAGSLI
jgi:integrase